MGSLKSLLSRNEATINDTSKKSPDQLCNDLIDSMHVVSSEELKSRRNPLYTYMI